MKIDVIWIECGLDEVHIETNLQPKPSQLPSEK